MMLKLYQRGALLIAAIVLVVIILVMVTAMSFLSVSNIGASGSHMSSAQAFYAANSGLERALYQFSKSDIACASLSNSAVTIGDGTSSTSPGKFSTTGTAYPLAAVTSTLSSAITNASTIIPFTVSAGVYTSYAPHGRILIESEEIDYSSISNSASVCGTAPCFLVVNRGENGTVAAAHGSGVNVYQPGQCLIQSTGTAGAATRVMQAAVRQLSVQSGSYLFTPQPVAAVSTTTVNITPVNPNRSFVVCQQESKDSHDMTRATCVLSSPAALVITIGGRSGVDTTNNTVKVQWYLVEFLNGVTVQRGLSGLPVGTSTLNVPISAVTLGRTFVIKSEATNEDSDTTDERWTTTAQLTTATNLQLVRNLTTTSIVSTAWQVIQHNSAAVQSNVLAIDKSAVAASNPVALSPAVNLAKTFAVTTFRAGSSVGGEERRFQTTGQFSDTTHLTFTRAFQGPTPSGVNTQVNLFWYSVAMSDATTVQAGTATPGGTGPTVNVAISSVAPSRSLPILTVRGDPASSTPQGDGDDTSWSAAFTTASNLQITRNNAAGGSTNANIAWFVVQFASQISLVDKVEYFP